MILMSAQLSLKLVKQFNLTQKYQANSDQFNIVLSTSNNLIALYNKTDIFIIGTQSKQIKFHFVFNTTQLLLDIDDNHMYLTDSYELIKMDLNTGNNETIINSTKANKLKSITYSPNYKYIYFINGSTIHYYQPYLQVTNPVKLVNTTNCPVDRLFVDSYTQTAISSSFDCRFCSFGISKDIFQFRNANSVPHCRTGNVNFMNGYLILTQDTITTKNPQIILINLQNLNIISYINQSSSNLSLQMLNIHNYMMSYGTGDSLLWLYKNSIVNQPQKISVPLSTLRSQFNTRNNQLYLLLANQNSNIQLISYKLAFNCANVSNSNHSLSAYDPQCSCKGNMFFDSSTQSCKVIQCSKNEYSLCDCPHQQSFDPFSLQCNLNCSLVYNSLSPIRYGNPYKCSCNYPFEWNAQLSDCSLIDCSLIKYSSNSTIAQSCRCKQDYLWNDTSLSCVFNRTMDGQSSSTSTPVGLIIGIIFIFLLIVLSAVIFYYKKYKKSPEDLPKTYQYPKEQYTHNPTPRPLFPQAKTNMELQDLSPPETQAKLNRE